MCLSDIHDRKVHLRSRLVDCGSWRRVSRGMGGLQEVKIHEVSEDIPLGSCFTPAAHHIYPLTSSRASQPLMAFVKSFRFLGRPRWL